MILQGNAAMDRMIFCLSRSKNHRVACGHTTLQKSYRGALALLNFLIFWDKTGLSSVL